MSDYKFIIKADEINGGLEGFEIDEETKAGYECNGFVFFADMDENSVCVINHLRINQLAAFIANHPEMMKAAKLAVMMQAFRGHNVENTIEKLFGLEG